MIEWYTLMYDNVDIFYNEIKSTKWGDSQIVKELFLAFPHTNIIETRN